MWKYSDNGHEAHSRSQQRVTPTVGSYVPSGRDY